MSSYYQTVAQIFASRGSLAMALGDYTCRDEQVRFANKVAEAFQDDLFLCAEAGTGVGKTFAYLIPALLWARQNHEKVVVSTKTLALQQQIVDRDLPQLKQVMDFQFKYFEAKGRENFLCWNKYQRILGGRKSLDKDQIEFVQKILSWAESTQSGDRKELGLSQDLMRNWDLVSADRNSCQREKCQYHDKCFRLRMIKGMGKADLIVVNHALLLSDVLVDNRIIPEYKRLIIDEAHAFIKETFDRFTYRFDKHDTLKLLASLFSEERRVKKGYLTHLHVNYPQISPQLVACENLVSQLCQATKRIFDGLTQGIKLPPNYNYNHIISWDDKEQDWLEDVIDAHSQIWKPAVDLLIEHLREIGQGLEDESENNDIYQFISILQETDESLFSILVEEIHSDSSTSWVEFSQGRAIAICAGGVQRGNILAGQLYENLDSLVMVSATLAVEENFDNFIARSGLKQRAQQGRVVTHLERSPFDYEHQACLYVVQDMPDPGSKAFSNAVTSVLTDIFSYLEGRTMVLFTSRQQLLETSAILRPCCEQRGLNLLVQHEDGDFASIKEEFINGDNSILMGVETFWEGIDLKGEVLRCLVIVKLPFRSPTDPYCSAWDHYFQSKHKNSFTHFMLPDAALRFKQGVGRLIRSETDRGAVVVLDTRLLSRNYGQVFIKSTPIKNIGVINREQLHDELAHWC